MSIIIILTLNIVTQHSSEFPKEKVVNDVFLVEEKDFDVRLMVELYSYNSIKGHYDFSSLLVLGRQISCLSLWLVDWREMDRTILSKVA